MTAMAPKRRAGLWRELVYVDLLAGPGRGVDRDTAVEFDGSPLRALGVTPKFDRLFFSDVEEKNVSALRKRIPAADLARTDIRIGDCNHVARDVMATLLPKTLGIAFIDPEGFEVRFELFKALARRRIDVLFLFPSGIGIRRNLTAFAKQPDSPLDALWGGREWRDLPVAKLAAGKRLTNEEAISLDKSWVLRFRAKMMNLGFVCQDEADPCFTNEKNVPMYHLLFFSHDPAGLTLWRGIKKIEPSGQRLLPW